MKLWSFNVALGGHPFFAPTVGVYQTVSYPDVEPGRDYFAAEAWERQRGGVVIEGARPLTGRVTSTHMEKGWLVRQIKRTAEDVKTLPNWLRTADPSR